MMRSQNNSLIGWLLILFAIIAYILPWITHPSASLSLGAYDLAEWASLVPALETSLLIRLQLVFIVWLVVLQLQSKWFTLSWWLLMFALGALAVAQLPPLDFFLSAQADRNYQQQFILTAIALVGAIAFFIPQIKRFHLILTVVIALAGIITSVIGAAQVIRQLERFSISVDLGVGSSLLVLCYLLLIVYEGRTFKANEAA